MTDSDIAAAVYCRISLAGIGDFTKTDDQERICREVARRLTWRVAEVYTDHARSAWQPNRKRPGWDKMLADIEAGKISAIVVYHGDRLLRTHEDLLKLINLARMRGIKLASPAGERDLGNPDDQFILEIEASMAKRESANTSRRRKAQYERWRREGRVRPGGRGGRAFGFDTKGDVIPAEADLIRHAATMILDGHTTGAATRWITAQGAVTPTGAPFTDGTLRKMLARPRYAGLMPDGTSPAAWGPVLDRETWEAVRALLDARAAGFGYATNQSRYLLSGIATCGVCGSRLQLRAESRKRGSVPGARDGYGCVKPGCRKVQRSIRLLDAYVAAAVVRRLNDPRNPPGRAPASPGLAAQFAALTTQQAELAALVADPDQPHLGLLLARLDAVTARLDQLRDRAGDTARLRVIAANRGITLEEFEARPLGTRRALVSALYTVTVLPVSRRGPGFNPDDIRMKAI